MENNQIHFNVNNNKVKVTFKKAMGLPDFLQVVQTGILYALNSYLESANDKVIAKEELYNLYNTACSNTLHYFAPEYDLHPNLTAEAILRAENDIIEERYRELKRGEQHAET
jgi:hypothetical protein